jgi:hypothetical protein
MTVTAPQQCARYGVCNGPRLIRGAQDELLGRPVGCELPVRQQLVFGTDRGNAAAGTALYSAQAILGGRSGDVLELIESNFLE